jgi:hypothetical protein
VKPVKLKSAKMPNFVGYIQKKQPLKSQVNFTVVEYVTKRKYWSNLLEMLNIPLGMIRVVWLVGLSGKEIII